MHQTNGIDESSPSLAQSDPMDGSGHDPQQVLTFLVGTNGHLAALSSKVDAIALLTTAHEHDIANLAITLGAPQVRYVAAADLAHTLTMAAQDAIGYWEGSILVVNGTNHAMPAFQSNDARTGFRQPSTQHDRATAEPGGTQEVHAPVDGHSSIAPRQEVGISIIIPAYNEAEALPHVLSSVFDMIDERFEVIVVDDGSKDATRAVAETYPCRVVVHPQNRGKGAAMQTGIASAHGEKIIFIDGDATDIVIELCAWQG